MAAAGSGGAGAGAIVRQGHLRKLKTMKKKYFALRAETVDCSARLEYYESEKKFRAGAAPRRVLPLKSCYNIMRRLDLKQKHVIALFTREEQFCIVAENEDELHSWLSDILRQHRSDDASVELLHPIQHVWQVNVQKKGLGASKNIQGLYNLCLTDKTLTLVKIKSQNNVISDLGIPERVEYSLKNIRRCGDSECFFYMEVGRQTVTGAGELWMHSDDSNIAQSMHSTIYHAMRNCAKQSENERDHIVVPKTPEVSTLPARRQTYSDGSGRAGLFNEKGLCVDSCIRQCVCASASYSIDDSAAAVAPLSAYAENQPPNNPLTDKPVDSTVRLIKHHRTVSLPTGCPLFQKPLKIVHERTRSAPLTGEEVDRVIVEKAVTHSSCKAINGTDVPAKKTQWRRASTGTRLSKLSPAHSKNNDTLRNRCVTMPSSHSGTSFEVDRPPPRLNDFEGVEVSRDEADTAAEWCRTPRIPEEPDCCDIPKDLISMLIRPASSIHHSRTSSLGVDDPCVDLGLPDGYMHMAPGHDPAAPDGYLPMAPGHDLLGGLISASSGSVCSGTPSTDPRFSEYQLEPATSHIGMEARPPRAYSVGSRPAARAPEPRHRAYSVGARQKAQPAPPSARHHACAALLPRASLENLMMLDFSTNSPAAKQSALARTPPASYSERAKGNLDEYVDMSPRNAGYVVMRPGESLSHPPPTRTPPTTPVPVPTTPDGYVEMNYGRAATRPIAIAASRPPPPPVATSPDDARRRRNTRENRTPVGSQTLFPLSLDSPASPPELDAADIFEEDPPHHALSTVREISEEGGRRSPEAVAVKRSPEVSSSPQYVTLIRPGRPKAAVDQRTPEPKVEELSCNPTATKTITRVVDAVDSRPDSSSTATVVLAGGGAPARFSLGEDKRSPPPAPSPSASPAPPSPSPTSCVAPLNYAALDLEPRRAPAASTPRAYTQIDFIRSEKLHAADVL